MRLFSPFLLLIGNDQPAVDKAVAVIRTITATRGWLARKAFGLLVIAALLANVVGLAVLLERPL